MPVVGKLEEEKYWQDHIKDSERKAAKIYEWIDMVCQEPILPDLMVFIW